MKDLTGLRFGKIAIISFDRVKNGKARWNGRCDCGREKSFMASHLVAGRSKTCGCAQGWGVPGDLKYLHLVWGGVKRRCTCVTDERYKDYGGRGIKLHKPWMDKFVFFKDVVDEIGHRPFGKKNGRAIYSLDRIDNDGNYEPGNIRWATQEIQTNNARSNIVLSMGGATKRIFHWSGETGIRNKLIQERIRTGWSADRALSTPKVTAVKFNLDGAMMTLAEIASKTGGSSKTIRRRLSAGMAIEEAIAYRRRGPRLKAA